MQFHHEPLRSCLKANVNKFVISSHTALKLGTYSLRSYLKVTCEYELHILPDTTVSTAENHGENYMKVRPPLVRHFCVIVYCLCFSCKIIGSNFEVQLYNTTIT